MELKWTVGYDRRKEPYTMVTHHFHNEYELYYLVEGERNYFIKDSLYTVGAGDIVFINRQTIHHTYPVPGNESHERFVLNIHPDFIGMVEYTFPEIYLDKLLEPPCIIVTLTGEEKSRVENDLWHIKGAVVSDPMERASAEIKIMDLLFSLYFKAERHAPYLAGVKSTSKPFRRANEICEYIMTKKCCVSLDEICDQFYLSKYYLCHMFKKVSGITIHRFITENRILLAERLLEHSSKPITAIGEEVGFGSISQFEKVFRQYTGTTPSQYRKQHYKKLDEALSV